MGSISNLLGAKSLNALDWDLESNVEKFHLLYCLKFVFPTDYMCTTFQLVSLCLLTIDSICCRFLNEKSLGSLGQGKFPRGPDHNDAVSLPLPHTSFIMANHRL